MVDPQQRRDFQHRVIVASPFKAGSTFCAEVVGRYIVSETLDLDYDWLAENVVTLEFLKQVRNRAFALNLHMRPHHRNLVACRDEAISVSVQWRNLADMIVSFDDHVFRYGAHNPVFYVNHDAFVAMPRRRRHRYLIDSIVSWNLGFYLSWRRLEGIVLHPYERMVRDPFGHFRDLIWMLGIPLDEARLTAVLEHAPTSTASRFNVGVVGRSAEILDEDERRHLERVILAHPEAEQLEVLLWELPWEPLELVRRSPHDGCVVMGSDAVPYFVSSGIRRKVRPTWLASRGPERLRRPIALEDAELSTLDMGTELL